MKKNGVIINSFTDVKPRELYRFITKELFKMLTTADFSKPLKLVYEEFHSNNEYLIIKAISDFVRLLFEKIYGSWRIKHLKHSLKNYKEIKSFLNTYEDIALDKMETYELCYDNNKANVIFQISYYGVYNNGLVHQFKGNGVCELVKNGENWNPIFLSLPDRIR